MSERLKLLFDSFGGVSQLTLPISRNRRGGYCIDDYSNQKNNGDKYGECVGRHDVENGVVRKRK